MRATLEAFTRLSRLVPVSARYLSERHARALVTVLRVVVVELQVGTVVIAVAILNG